MVCIPDEIEHLGHNTPNLIGNDETLIFAIGTDIEGLLSSEVDCNIGDFLLRKVDCEGTFDAIRYATSDRKLARGTNALKVFSLHRNIAALTDTANRDCNMNHKVLIGSGVNLETLAGNNLVDTFGNYIE